MYKYLLQTKKFYESIENPTIQDCENLKNHIHNFQHERLVHLIVTCLFAVIFLYSFTMSLFVDNTAWFFLSIILLILESAYIAHYFHLENGVQYLYHIYDELKLKAEQQQ